MVYIFLITKCFKIFKRVTLYAQYNATSDVLSPAELFLITHQKPDKSFVDDRSKGVWDKYQELKTKRRAKDWSDEDFGAFFEVVGGRSKKGTVYGLGNLVDFYYEMPPKSSQASKSMPSSSIMLQLQDELRATQEELKEHKKQSEEQRRQIEEQKRQYQKGMTDLKYEMDQLSQQLHGCNVYSSFDTPNY